MNVLTVNDLHLDYGSGASANPILKGVSMHLQRGEVVALLGPSGSGKTTLLRAVAGLESPKSGTIDIGERRVFDGSRKLELPAEARNLGLVFQSYALWPHKTVFDNVAYGLKLRKMTARDIEPKVREVLAQLGLGHLGERFPHQLSGGQQQRVAIARALVYNPPVILLDEPLSNLDAKLREEARAFLRELIVRLGLSALMVTHDQAEAMAISDRILLLNNGKIEQQGTPQSMYEAPDTLFTAEFMGSNNRLPARVVARQGGAARLQVEGMRRRRIRSGRRCRRPDPRGRSAYRPHAGGQRHPAAAVDLHVPGRPLGVPVQARQCQRARVFQAPHRSGQLLARDAGREALGLLSARCG